MALSRAGKETHKADLSDKFQRANAAILAEYRGLTVAELSELRGKLREIDAEFKVVKNRVAKVSISEDAPDAKPIVEGLKGPVGVVFVYGDTVEAAKSVLEFAKENKDHFKVTQGLMDGQPVTEENIKEIASLPSREEMMGKIVGSLVAPHRNLVGVLNGVQRQLVQVINAIKDTKQQ